MEITAADFCEYKEGTNTLRLTPAKKDAPLRLNSLLQKLGKVQFSFAGDDKPPLVLVQSNNAALLSVYTPPFLLLWKTYLPSALEQELLQKSPVEPTCLWNVDPARPADFLRGGMVAIPAANVQEDGGCDDGMCVKTKEFLLYDCKRRSYQIRTHVLSDVVPVVICYTVRLAKTFLATAGPLNMRTECSTHISLARYLRSS